MFVFLDNDTEKTPVLDGLTLLYGRGNATGEATLLRRWQTLGPAGRRAYGSEDEVPA